MDTKTFIVNVLKIVSWPTVILILGLNGINLFLSETAQFVFPNLNPIVLNINANHITAFGTIITAITAIVALILTYKTGIFDKTPNILASGTFIISTKNEDTNKIRDKAIKELSIHTIQLINVGRGLAKNIIPSRKKDVRGEFLEDVCPHSFVLPPGKSTNGLGEILRVHGQIFKRSSHKLEFENDDTSFFYIYFEDYSGKSAMTKVTIKKVGQADGEIGELVNTDGIEAWKVMENTTEEI